MGGVDRGDQIRGFYQCRTKCRKFYEYILHFLLDVFITNSYIPHKESLVLVKSLTGSFLTPAGEELIGEYSTKKWQRRPRLSVSRLPVRDEEIGRRHKRGICSLHSSRTREPWQLGNVESVKFGSAMAEIPAMIVFYSSTPDLHSDNTFIYCTSYNFIYCHSIEEVKKTPIVIT